MQLSAMLDAGIMLRLGYMFCMTMLWTALGVCESRVLVSFVRLLLMSLVVVMVARPFRGLPLMMSMCRLCSMVV